MDNKKLKPKKKKILLFSFAVIFLAVGGLSYYLLLPEDEAEMVYQTGKVKQGDIVYSLEGSGIIDYVDQNDLVSNVSGTISELYVKEGSKIEAGDTILKIDNSDIQLQIDQLYNDLRIAQLKLADLLQTTVEAIDQVDLDKLSTVYAPIDGVVDYSIQEGAYINNSTPIMTIEDNEKIYFIVEVKETNIDRVKTGQSVEILVFDFTDYVTGVVDKIGNYAHSDGYSMVYDVYVLVDNPGMLEAGMEGSANIETSQGVINELGKFSKYDEEKVYSKIGGTIEKIYVDNGELVKQGEPLFTIDDASLINSVETQRLSIENIKLKIAELERELEDSIVKTDYSGTVSDLYVTRNQTLNNNAKIATVTSNDLVARIEVDELDIGKVRLGQIAEVYIPAYANEPVTGKVTYISDTGIVKDGITTYEVYLSLEANEGIKSGMTVDASIILEKAESVLMVPTTSVIDIKGGKAVRVLQGEEIVSKGVEIGLSNDTMTEIKNGLELSDIIITSLTYTNTSTATTTPSTNSSLMPNSVNVPGISGPGGGGGSGK